MSRLLRANFSRLWKTTAFWGCMFFSVAVPMFMEILDGIIHGIFVEMYNTTPIPLFFSAVFAVMYIGTDNSEGTLCNRLIIGISRVKIYLANFVTVSCGMLLIFAVSWASRLTYTIVRGGRIDIKAENLALYTVVCLAAGAAMMAVCTLLATLITSRSVATAVTISLTIGMFAATLNLFNFAQSSFAAELAYNMLPTSQVSEIQTNVAFMDSSPEVFTLARTIEPLWYSLGACVSFTAVGALLFRKKNLK